MEKLYEITGKFYELMKADDLTDEELAEQSDELQELLIKKQASLIFFVRQNEASIEAIKTEKKRLDDLQRALENRLARFKAYVKKNMEAMDIVKLETDFGKMTIAKNPMSIEIIDEKLVPDDYKNVKEVVSIDKTAIAEHYKKTGEVVAGTIPITDKTSLRVK